MPSLANGERYFADWRRTPANWNRPYFWMKRKLDRKTGLNIAHPPIWCWHSCDGAWRGPPTVGTANMLLAADEIQSGMVAIELLVPKQLVLLSSYHLWNDFVEVFLKTRRIPSRRHNTRRLFDEPLLTNDCDSIQAVIPFIEPEWVQRSFDLVVDGRDWGEMIFVN
ncbi:DUF3841 domain-containing protein [bacterium]|nr:DUF3841 domain-containing protein [bacterium]